MGNKLSESDFKAERGQGVIQDPTAATAGMKAKNKRRADSGLDKTDPMAKGADPEAVRATNAALNSSGGKMVEELEAALDELDDDELEALAEELGITEEMLAEDDREFGDDDDDEDYDDEDELDDEELDEIEIEDPYETMASEVYEAFKVESNDLDLNEFASVVGGQNLSEDFQTTAKNLFEAAVVKTVNDRVAMIAESVANLSRELLAEKEEMLVGILDSYVDQAIERWAEENEVAIESSIRADLAENFMSSIKTVLDEHYIDLPEDKVDVAAALATKNDQLKDHLNEAVDELNEARAELDAYRKRDIVVSLADNLTENQTAKLYELVENLSYESDDQFKRLVEDVKTNNFGGPRGGSRVLTEDTHRDLGDSSSKLDPAVQAAFSMMGNAPKK